MLEVDSGTWVRTVSPYFRALQLIGFAAIQYAKYMGRRVIAIGLSFFCTHFFSIHSRLIDGGEEKRKLCEELGADAWIDYTVSQDIVADVKKITDGRGAHAAVVTTASSSGYVQAVDYLRENGHLMAVGLPGDAKLEASIFFTVFKVRLF